MERAEVVDPDGEEMADLDAVLVVGEDGRGELGAGNVDFGHETKAFANINGGSEAGVASGGPIGGVGPLRDDNRHRTAFQDIVVDVTGFTDETAGANLHGGFLEVARNEQKFRVDGHLGTKPIHSRFVANQHSLLVDTAGDCVPGGGGEGGGAEVGMTAIGGDRCDVEEGFAITHFGTCATIGREDIRDEFGNLAHASGGQFAGVGFKLAGVVAVNQFEGEGQVAAVLDEAGDFAGVANLELGVGPPFRDDWQVSDRANQGAGDIVEGVEVFLDGDVFPPVVTGTTKVVPGVGDNLVEGVADEGGKVGGGGQLDAVGVIAAVEVVIAGESEVELADAGKARGFDVRLVGFAASLVAG